MIHGFNKCFLIFLRKEFQLIVVGFIPQPLPVETARVTQGALRATVNEEGKTRIQQRYVVSAPVTGHLRRIPFKAGAEVEAGRPDMAPDRGRLGHRDALAGKGKKGKGGKKKAIA